MKRGRRGGRGRGPLVRVELAPGRFVKMYKEDAAAQGLLETPPSQKKGRRPEQNKAVITGGSDTSAGAFVRPGNDEVSTRVLTEAEADGIADDFTTIDGIGKAGAELLRERGYLTFGDLRFMIVEELEDLPARVRRAVKDWRDGE